MGKSMSKVVFTNHNNSKNQKIDNRCKICPFEGFQEPIIPNNKSHSRSNSIHKVANVLGVCKHQVSANMTHTKISKKLKNNFMFTINPP